MQFLWVFVVACLVQCTLGANILALLPMPSKSHGILVERLLRTLDERGHQITYITSTVPGKPLGKTKVIHIPTLLEAFLKDNSLLKESGGFLQMKGMSPWRHMYHMAPMGVNLCDHLLQQEPVQKIIHSKQKFHLILGQIFLTESLLAGFSVRFDAPVVAIQTLMPGIWANYLVGNPSPSSYIPDPFLGLSSRMTFLERAHNLAFTFAAHLHHTMSYLPKQDAVMRKYFGNDLPSIHDIVKNTSLVLVNHHHSLGFARPYGPNMVEIAGVHIDKAKPLPKDLQAYMDNSKEGVILFSMGTNVKSSDLPPQITQAILKAFSRVKQNVLWKFESELSNLPKNVKIMNWIPQSDVLAHPNMRVFITHGGLLSTTEAVDRGVPVVGIPIFGDQPLNMKHTENAGLGKTIQFDDLSEENLYNVLHEIINNPKYGEVAQAKSKLLKDNPMPALESAVWWVEYVLRHKGAPHLRSAAQDLAWYQLYLLDVYALLALVFVAGIIISLRAVRFIKSAILKNANTMKNKKNN